MCQIGVDRFALLNPSQLPPPYSPWANDLASYFTKKTSYQKRTPSSSDLHFHRLICLSTVCSVFSPVCMNKLALLLSKPRMIAGAPLNSAGGPSVNSSEQTPSSVSLLAQLLHARPLIFWSLFLSAFSPVTPETTFINVITTSKKASVDSQSSSWLVSNV